ncbi:ImmA/IrrE family metallo-endopeptidase [Shinella sp.]|uniref:ImmA/IrrE family metallo-endopeptidase n=1 Tax=Shinella sp. TaxID=1870904 RepID=UPI003F6FC00A
MAVLRRTVSAPRDPREYGPEGAASDARKIAQQNVLKLIPLDVRSLAEVLGLTIEAFPMDENTSGYLENIQGTWTLGVNSLHHRNRQRFTIAHEIGHYFLHRDHSSFRDGLLFRKAVDYSPHEREANVFASLLLMPRLEFQRALMNADLAQVADMFGVSKQAAQYRLEHLGTGEILG